MFARITRQVLKPYIGMDVLTQQRAWVLLLVNVVGIVFSCAVAIFTMTYQGEPARSPDVWTGFAIAATMLLSTALLMRGKYRVSAHVSVALPLAAMWTLIFLKFAPLSHRTEVAYVIAILALPALLLGRFWTVFYGVLSLILMAATSARLAQRPGTTLRDAVALAVDVAVATIFVVVVTVLMTHIYEVALKRVRELLAQQQNSNLALLDLTASLEQSEAQKRQFYRETIYSVTSGKLSISDQSAIDPLLETTELDIEVTDAASVSEARQLIRGFFEANGLQGSELDSFSIGAGEAITNSIKHARGGRVRCGVKDGAVWVASTDQGNGIESLILPKAVLLPGFSTKPSLGLGYTIMLEVADSILLKTGATGTTVVLIKKPGAHQPEGLAVWPDTWESAGM